MNDPISLPVSKCNSRSVLSLAPDRARRPSGSTATVWTAPLWPSNTCRLAPVSRSHIRVLEAREELLDEINLPELLIPCWSLGLEPGFLRSPVDQNVGLAPPG